MENNVISENDILAEATKILSKWNLSIDQCYRILKTPNPSESKHPEQEVKAYLNESHIEQIQLLIQIDKALHQLLDNPENASAFMCLPNHNNYFDGRTPIGIIEEGETTDTREVLTRIKSIMSPW